MINIFNLFLVLFSLWILFSYANHTLSWFYIFFGLVSSAIVSFISWKIKIINKYSNFLFLNFGFYRHFFYLIFGSFVSSMVIIFKMVMDSDDINPEFYSVEIKRCTNSELILLITTINLMPGLVCLGFKNKEIIIYALSKRYFKGLNLNKVYKNLHHINDNRLV